MAKDAPRILLFGLLLGAFLEIRKKYMPNSPYPRIEFACLAVVAGLAFGYNAARLTIQRASESTKIEFFALDSPLVMAGVLLSAYLMLLRYYGRDSRLDKADRAFQRLSKTKRAALLAVALTLFPGALVWIFVELFLLR